MFLNFLLFHIAFIISVLRVDVLLGQQENGTQSGETGVGLLKSSSLRNGIQNNTQERFRKPKRKVQFGGRKIRRFNENKPPNKVADKKKQRDRKPSKSDRKHDKLPIERFLKKFTLSTQIWYYVWSDCKHIKCYSQNHYARLIGKFMEETNLYRKIHGSKPLEKDVQLTKLAVSKAKKSAKLGKLIYNLTTGIGENSIVCSKYYAPLVVYMWYEENSKHIYKTFGALQNSMHFSNLVWKNATKVGIGVAERVGFLYIYFEFWPETNQRFRFRENVLKPRYHWYNYRSLFKM